MDTAHKLQVLQDIYTDKAVLNQILEKLLQVTLNQHRSRLQRYTRELEIFEKQFGIKSDLFHSRFEAGEMGDAMDYFEWAGLYELYQDILEKVQRLEQAL